MKQIADWRQRKSKHDTPQIDVVADAVLKSPMHAREQVKCFRDMSKNNQYQTTGCD